MNELSIDFFRRDEMSLRSCGLFDLADNQREWNRAFEAKDYLLTDMIMAIAIREKL